MSGRRQGWVERGREREEQGGDQGREGQIEAGKGAISVAAMPLRFPPPPKAGCRIGLYFMYETETASDHLAQPCQL